jgi:hypothetical protein
MAGGGHRGLALGVALTEEAAMGSTHHDPTDHFRTTQHHAGEFFINLYCWPGLVSIALGIISLVGCLAAAAYNHHEWVLTTGVVGALAIVGGVAWLVLEHHRVLRIEDLWLANQQGQKPTGTGMALSPPSLRSETAAQHRHSGLPQRNRVGWA